MVGGGVQGGKRSQGEQIFNLKGLEGGEGGGGFGTLSDWIIELSQVCVGWFKSLLPLLLQPDKVGAFVIFSGSRHTLTL